MIKTDFSRLSTKELLAKRAYLDGEHAKTVQSGELLIRKDIEKKRNQVQKLIDQKIYGIVREEKPKKKKRKKKKGK